MMLSLEPFNSSSSDKKSKKDEFAFGVNSASQDELLNTKTNDSAVDSQQMDESEFNPSGIFGQDNRQRVNNTTVFPFSAVARIITYWSNGDVSITSGALISPYHALTAGHSIYDSSQGGWAQRAEVIVGSKGTIIDYERANFEYYGVANSVNFRADSNWINTENLDYDFGLITLDRNIGNYTGWFQYGYNNNLSNGTQVNVAGYGSDFFDSNQDGIRDNYDMTYQVGAITGITPLTLESSDLDVAGGNSGSPVWVNQSDRSIIYGVVSNITYNSITRVSLYNGFTRITESRFNDINSWINEDNAVRQPIDKPDWVDYDEWFGTNLSSISSSQISPGNSWTVTTIIRNNGTATAFTPSINVSFYASADSQINTNDYKIGDIAVSFIAPFSSQSLTWTGSFPNIPTGNYYVGWIFDSDNQTLEFDELNNKGILQNQRLTVSSSSPSTNPLLSAPVYRFFNTQAGGHFFTASTTERDNVIRNLPQYNYEGVGFQASTVLGQNLSPVYRFFNTVAGGHFFTINETERNFVQTSLPQYVYEGIGFYSYGADSNLGNDVYRFFNTVAGGHFFTISQAERDSLINNLPQYIYEGIGFEAAT